MNNQKSFGIRMIPTFTFYISTILLLLFQSSFTHHLQAQSTIRLEEYATDFTLPVDIAHAGDDRLFIVEQRGHIKIIQADGTKLEKSFLNIQNKIAFGGEKGLLGLAFHPDYKNNGLFYINYTDVSGNTNISSIKISNDPNVADLTSEQVLLKIDQPFGNHNGGCLKFGKDGYLYIGLGDGGSARDPRNNAQNNQVLLGKMLRIDVAGGNTYAIPPDNPFINDPLIPDEIWATGLRNPWRYSFDRLTDDLWIADVGQDSFEEINFVPANSNNGIDFGWRCYEANAILNANGCAPKDQFQFPILAYPTKQEVGRSITGGYVYRGTKNPELYGKYIYGDFLSGRIWALTPLTNGLYDNQEGLKIGQNEISTFGEDSAGELFVAAYASGKIFQVKQLVATATQEEIIGLKNFLLMPNPVNNKLYIQLTTNELVDLNFQIIDLIGRVVLEKNNQFLGQMTEHFELSNLNMGTYFLKISSKDGMMVKKILKF